MANMKKWTVLLGIAVVGAIGIFSFKQPQPQPRPKFEHNFKVLPKDISHDSLDNLMDSYNMALGVKCNFCHAKRADNPDRIDPRSDANPVKDEARFMINMTNEMNAKYFKDLKSVTTKATQIVTCLTCHNGKELPAQ